MNPYESPAGGYGRIVVGKSLRSQLVVVGTAAVCFLLSSGVGVAAACCLVWAENIPISGWFACYQRYGMPSLVYGGVSAFLLPMLVKRQVNAAFLAVSVAFVGLTYPSNAIGEMPTSTSSDVMVLYGFMSFAITALASRSIRGRIGSQAVQI